MITEDLVDALLPKETVWDAEIPGFGVIANNRTKSYKLRYYFHGCQRVLTIGTNRDLTVAEARKIAYAHRARIRAGFDPVAEERPTRLSVRALCDEYVRKRASCDREYKNAADDESLIQRYIVPILGDHAVHAIGADDVACFRTKVDSICAISGDTCVPTALSVREALVEQCLRLLSRMFDMAEASNYRPKGSNPIPRAHQSYYLDGIAKHTLALPWHSQKDGN